MKKTPSLPFHVLVFFLAVLGTCFARGDALFLKEALPRYKANISFLENKEEEDGFAKEFLNADRLWDNNRESFQEKLPNLPIYAGLNYAMSQQKLTDHLRELFSEYRRRGKLYSRDEWMKCVRPTKEQVSSPARKNPMNVFVSVKGPVKWIEKTGGTSIYRFLASEWINSWNNHKLKAPMKIMVTKNLSDFTIRVVDGWINLPHIVSANVDVFAEKIEGGHFSYHLLNEWLGKLQYNDESTIWNPSNNMIDKDGVQYIIDLEYHAVQARQPESFDWDPYVDYARMRSELKFPLELRFDLANIEAPNCPGLQPKL